MPLYEYECDACGNRFEMIRLFSDPPLDTCPKCGGAVRKLMSSPAIQFKGSGFYITDYAKKDESAAKKSDNAGDKAEKAAQTEGGTKDAAPKEKADKPSEKSSTSDSTSTSTTSTAASPKKE